MNKKLPSILIVIIIVSILPLSGCGAIYGINQMNEHEQIAEDQVSAKEEAPLNLDSSYIYYGTRIDLVGIGMTFECMFDSGCGGMGRYIILPLTPILIAGIIVDIPLSFALDTLMLPFSISKDNEIKKNNNKNNNLTSH